MKTRIRFFVAVVLLAPPVLAVEALSFGPATANARKFAHAAEEISAGHVAHPGGKLILEYRALGVGSWDGAARVDLTDDTGRVVAGVCSYNYTTRGGLFTEVVFADGRVSRVPADAGRQAFDLPAGRYTLTGRRATHPRLPECDLPGGPIPHAVNLEVSVIR